MQSNGASEGCLHRPLPSCHMYSKGRRLIFLIYPLSPHLLLQCVLPARVALTKVHGLCVFFRSDGTGGWIFKPLEGNFAHEGKLCPYRCPSWAVRYARKELGRDT